MKKKAWSLVLVAAMLIAAVIIAIPNAKAEATPEFYPDTYPAWHCECGNIWADPLSHNGDEEAPTTDLHYMYGEGKCKHEGSYGCDGTLYKWTAFTGTSMATTGNYYLTADFTPSSMIYVGDGTVGSDLRIDLNGHKIQKSLTRLFTNNASGTTKGKGDLVILDSSKDNTGAVINTILKPVDSKGNSVQGNIYWRNAAGIFTVYNAKLSTPNIVAATSATAGDGLRHGGQIVYAVSTGGSVNFFDCKIIAGNSYGMVSTTVHGGNAIYATSGAVNVIGGSITGGKNTAGYGGAIWVKGATLTMRNCTVSGGSAAKGGNIYVSGAKNATLENVTLTGGKVGEKAEDIRFEGTGDCKITGSSTVERAVFDADVAASAAYDLTGLTADSNVTLEVVTTDAEKDITASVIAKNVTEEMGTYVHIANAAPGEGEVYYLSTDGTLKLGKIQCECGGTLAGTEGHTCERKVFLPITQDTLSEMLSEVNGTKQMIPAQAGHSYFYLNEDINLSETSFAGKYLFLNSGKYVHLDLHGHKLDLGTGYIRPNSTGMSICDSVGGGEFTAQDTILRITKDDYASGSLTLFGGKVTSSSTTSTVISMLSGTLNIYGGEICREESVKNGQFTTSVVTLNPANGTTKKAKVNMAGGTITGSSKTDGGGAVVLTNNGGGTEFNMSGGEIRGGSATTYGGNVYVQGTFKMSGGTISNGKSDANGGNIFVGSYGTFNFQGGTIENGTADKGGNVFVYAKADDVTRYGTFTMGGTAQITGGTAREIGSGVYANGVFTMDGGAITGGTARNGSVNDAVVAGIRKVTLNGGTITGTDYALTVVGGSVTTGEEVQWLDELTIGGVTLTAPTQVYFLNGDPAFDVTHMVIPTGTFTAAAQVSGKNISVGAGNADTFGAVFGGQKVDDDTVVFTADIVANDGTNDFNTVQAAVDSDAAVITLKSGVQENIDAAGKTFTLLLNGNVIYGNIQNAENVTFVDTTSTLDVAGSGRIYGTIENAPVASYNAGKRYMVIPHEAEGYYTVDRFYYSVTKVTQHANGEMGFIANIAGNENVTNFVKPVDPEEEGEANCVFRFQFALVQNGQIPADGDWKPSNSRTGLTVTPGYDGSNLNIIVEGVWTEADDNVLTNKSIAVRPVFTVNGQEVKMNYRVASMKNICVQLVNAANGDLNEQQLGGLRTLYKTHKALIDSWETEPDSTFRVPEVLKNAQ